ncbi:16S rRNA uridine-516 pseudouridylate synthase and related pseudouridylate synthases [Candidatus Scalindua japonica]|uniref:16S rRNA uridine-516 pseudouridylate synthase and related pseudouridylate synthases n=1 Tax=Candidatus Scalindua japonica TaxID=1284222 RepID=A0A286TUW4_9BACT|nr:hypothetical protein [Candidatus Scalindua japonica]GAX59666.1 16S rRNA uridine-516 pseudouridylate synthase and related pseudouridylate synthases [Candidatus Scalindua japonica]
MTKQIDKNRQSKKLGERKKICKIDTEPKDLKKSLEGLTAPQKALREASIRKFKVNKVKAFIAEQVKHININRQIGDSIRFLFDKDGEPPVNLPLEDIIAERMKIETQIRWFEALCSELRNNLSKVKEIEDLALDLIDQYQGEI